MRKTVLGAVTASLLILAAVQPVAAARIWTGTDSHGATTVTSFDVSGGRYRFVLRIANDTDRECWTEFEVDNGIRTRIPFRPGVKGRMAVSRRLTPGTHSFWITSECSWSFKLRKLVSYN